MEDRLSIFLGTLKRFDYGFGDGSGYGDGYGSGYGSGYGDGYGYGEGYGYGNGSGNGYCEGEGDGEGDGEGVKSYCGQDVYNIDSLPTLVYAISPDCRYARGAILQDDLTLKPCYIARVDDSFAHGDTLHQASRDAMAKSLEDMSEDERIAQFLDAHKDKETYPAQDLYEWHGILTGSCKFGRTEFCRSHNIDLQRDSFTLQEFIKLTENQYGGEIIRQIKIG